MRSSSPLAISALALTLLAAACGDDAPAVSVQIVTAPATLASGATQQFQAAVSNAADQTVTWSVREANGGTIDAAGDYQAPVVEAAAVFDVVATAVADPTQSASVAVTVEPLGVRVWPLTLTLPSGGTRQFDGSVYAVDIAGHSSDALTWSIAAGNGTVSATGLYTAPAAAGTYRLTATSQVDPTQSASATITVLDASVADREGALWPVPVPASSNYTTTADTVLDKTTGLLWQRTPSDDRTWEDAKSYCASLSLDGQTGWSLPTRIELASLLIPGQQPAIDPTAFPNIGTDVYGRRTFYSSSSTPSSSNVFAGVFLADFHLGAIVEYANFNPEGPISDDYAGPQSVLCVHAPPAAAIERYTLTTNTAYDNWTHLTWARATIGGYPAGSSWSDANASCQGLSLEGVSSGWRLPTLLELSTTVDGRTTLPAADTTVFPGTTNYLYWSSTSDINGDPQGVYFDYGATYNDPSSVYGDARCVH